MDMVRGAGAPAEDSLAAYRLTNGRAAQEQLEALLGIRQAATLTATSNADILANISDIKNDPTGRRTLKWTVCAATIAFITLLASIWVPYAENKADAIRRMQADKDSRMQHEDEERVLRVLHGEIRQQHADSLRMEGRLIRVIVPRPRKS